MDLIITIGLIYLAYRGYQWYTRMQQQVKGGPPPHRRVDHDEPIDITPQEQEERDDYIDYEEVK